VSGRPTRHIVDDVNHDELIGAPGGGVPEAPQDDTTFGRLNRGWTRVLSLGGGELSGPLNLPNGSAANPSLQLGAADGTGLSRAGNAIVMSVGGSTIFGTFAGSAQFYGQLSMLNNRLTQVANPTAAGDALNLRTGDERYAPGPWQDFVPDPGWTSVLRYRLVAEGMQIEGAVEGALPANATGRIGIFPAGYRPARRQFLMGTVSVGLSVGWGTSYIEADGQMFTYWSIAGGASFIALNGVVAMD
jgi:hypothetical protein